MPICVLYERVATITYRCSAGLVFLAALAAGCQRSNDDEFARTPTYSGNGASLTHGDSNSSPSSVLMDIENVLTEQAKAWNDGNIERFMESYWKSDNLTFSSGGAVTRGWDATLANYRRRYATRADMGQLTFDKLNITPLGDAAALVLGEWHLERETDSVGGDFSLVFRRIDNRWLIIHDHTSRAD